VLDVDTAGKFWRGLDSPPRGSGVDRTPRTRGPSPGAALGAQRQSYHSKTALPTTYPFKWLTTEPQPRRRRE